MGNAIKQREEKTSRSLPSHLPSKTDLVQKCWEYNQWAKGIGFARWWYVAERDGVNSILTKDGDEVIRFWKMFDGYKPDYVNWSQEKLDEEYRIMRWVIRNGMDEDSFNRTCLAYNA